MGARTSRGFDGGAIYGPGVVLFAELQNCTIGTPRDSSPSSTFSSTAGQGNSAKLWNTMATPSVGPSTGSPRHRTSPAVGRNRAETMHNSVDLPERSGRATPRSRLRAVSDWMGRSLDLRGRFSLRPGRSMARMDNQLDRRSEMAELREHIVKRYGRELAQLHGLLLQMGGKVESQLATAVRSVLERDGEAAKAAVEQDQTIDALERDVEQLVVGLFALRQPVAIDLRNVVAGIKISSALERIGDYAANIAKRSPLLIHDRLPPHLTGLASMARLVQENVRLTVNALDLYDADRAIRVWYADEAVDDLFTVIFRELMTYMMEDPRNIASCTHLLFMAKSLERIGDHTTNIAEMVYYAATGEVLLDARPKGKSPGYTDPSVW